MASSVLDSVSALLVDAGCVGGPASLGGGDVVMARELWWVLRCFAWEVVHPLWLLMAIEGSIFYEELAVAP